MRLLLPWPTEAGLDGLLFGRLEEDPWPKMEREAVAADEACCATGDVEAELPAVPARSRFVALVDRFRDGFRPVAPEVDAPGDFIFCASRARSWDDSQQEVSS